MRLSLIVVVLVGILLAACGPASNQAPGSSTEGQTSLPAETGTNDLADLVEVELDLPEEVPHNQRARIRLSVHNRHPEAHLALSNAHYDLQVLQEDGTEVHRTGQNFRSAPTLAPGESQDYPIIWPQLSEGRCLSDVPGQCRNNPAPPGRYDVRATFLAGFAQVLQDGETLAVVEDGAVPVNPGEIIVTEEEGDPDAWPPSLTETPVDAHPAQRLTGGIRASEQVDQGETATLKMVAGNDNDSPLEVPLRRPMYDFTVSTLDGTQIWRWSDTQESDDTPVTLRLEPNEWEEWDVGWDLRDRDGNSVPAGWYEVQGWLRLAPEGEQARDRQLLLVGPRPGLEEVVRVSLEAPHTADLGEPVPLQFTIENISGGIVRLFYGGDLVTFEVLDKEGEKIWPGPRVIEEGLGIMELLPGQVRQVERVWPQERVKAGDQMRNSEREPAPPGHYTIVSWFASGVGDSTTDIVENQEEFQLEPHSLEVRPPVP